MNVKTTLPISEARKKIFEITRRVQKSNTYYTLTDKGRPSAVILSAEEFESWIETLEVLRDFPNIKKDIKEAERDYLSGEYRNYTNIDEILRKEGYDKVSNQSKTYR